MSELYLFAFYAMATAGNLSWQQVNSMNSILFGGVEVVRVGYRFGLLEHIGGPASRWTCLNAQTGVMHVVNRLVVNIISCLSF